MMIQQVVKKRTLNDTSQIQEDLGFWLKKPPEERIAAVEYLRRQYHGHTARLQRVVRVLQQAPR